MSIYFSEVPEYLHYSEYYKLLDNREDDEDFEVIVGKYYPPENDEVNNINDFILLFHVYGMWGSRYSKSFIDFMEKNRLEVGGYLKSIENEFTHAKKLLEELFIVYIPIIIEDIGVTVGKLHFNKKDAIIDLFNLFLKNGIHLYNYFMIIFKDYQLLNLIIII